MNYQDIQIELHIKNIVNKVSKMINKIKSFNLS